MSRGIQIRCENLPPILFPQKKSNTHFLTIRVFEEFAVFDERTDLESKSKYRPTANSSKTVILTYATARSNFFLEA